MSALTARERSAAPSPPGPRAGRSRRRRRGRSRFRGSRAAAPFSSSALNGSMSATRIPITFVRRLRRLCATRLDCVAELLDHRAHALEVVLGDAVAVVDHLRHGRNRDAGRCGDVADRDSGVSAHARRDTNTISKTVSISVDKPARGRNTRPADDALGHGRTPRLVPVAACRGRSHLMKIRKLLALTAVVCRGRDRPRQRRPAPPAGHAARRASRSSGGTTRTRARGSSSGTTSRRSSTSRTRTSRSRSSPIQNEALQDEDPDRAPVEQPARRLPGVGRRRARRPGQGRTRSRT